MNWLKKGPELKLPKLRKPSLKRSGSKGSGIKPPALLADLYYDLRDRRLLLPIALVLVATAAVPFLIGSDPEPLPPPPAQGAAELEAATARTSSLTVVESTPGLRDYRKRLEGRSASDPFKQQYTQSAAGGGEAGGGSGDASSSEESVTIEGSSTTVEVDPGGSGGGSGSGSGGRAPADGPDQGTQLIEFVFNVQISRTETTANGGRKMSEPEVRRRVPTLAQLPGRKTPVVTVAGVNLRNGKVWFLVSDDVKSLDGDFNCVTRTPNGLCELLEIEVGFPLELVYGPDDVLYRIKVTQIDAVRAGKVGAGASSVRAAFGGPARGTLPVVVGQFGFRRSNSR